MLETLEVDNNKIRKALFVNLRTLDMYTLLQKYPEYYSTDVS